MFPGIVEFVVGLLKVKIPAPVMILVVLAMGAPLVVQQVKLASRAHEIRVLDGKVSDLGSKLQASTASLLVCQTNRTELSNALSDQNQRIASWKFQADAKIAEAEALAIHARANQAQAESTAARLRALKGGSCADFQAADAAVLQTLH